MRRIFMLVWTAAIAGAVMIGVVGLALAPSARASSGAAAVASGATAASPAAVPEPSPSVTPTLELTAAPATITWGKATVLTIQLSLGNSAVRLSRRAAGAEVFKPVDDFTTSATGVVNCRVAPRVTTVYRAEFIDGSQAELVTAEVTVSVRPKISFAAPGSVYKGQRARLSIRVRPAHPGGRVTIELWRGGAWTAWRTVTLNAQSRTLRTWRADRVGRQRIRVRMEADTEHAAGVSRVRRVTVRKPNPYRVPVSAKRIVVVDKSEYRLYFFSYGREIKSFPCVLGRPSLPTPLGHFRIYAKGMWPGGPFGARIMSYHSPYAIHGTNQPHLLSRFPRNYSHGCTRLANANAVWLYDHAPTGTPVWNVR